MEKAKWVKLAPFIYFPTLVFFVLAPLLQRGYVFLLDFVFTPNNQLNFSTYVSGQRMVNSLPFNSFVYLLSLLFSVDIVEKIILVALFLLILFSIWHALEGKLTIIPRLIASTFYLLNPFVYERFMAGHIGILFGYAFLPLTLKFFFLAFEKKDNKNILFSAMFWTLQIIFAPHFLVIMGVGLAVMYILNLIIRDDTAGSVGLATKVFLKIIFSLFIFNSFWLIPALFSQNGEVFQINVSHFEAYRSAPDNNYGLFTNLVGMYGFWRERTSGNEILLTKDFLPIWPAFFTIFLIPIYFGIKYFLIEKKYPFLWFVAIIGFFGIFFAFGPQEGWVGSVNRLIFSYIPAFKGLRESQKFISLLVWAYTVLIAYGLYFLQTRLKKKIYILITLAVFFNIFIYNFKFLWGAGGQVKAQEYPVSFVQAKNIFDADKEEYKTLILPWHMYLIGHPLAQGRTIIDPAPAFFYPHSLIKTSNPEVGYEITRGAEEKEIELLLKSTDASYWHEFLKQRNIKYIFVTKVKEPLKHGFDYNFLLNNGNFLVIVEDDKAMLIKLSTSKKIQ